MFMGKNNEAHLNFGEYRQKIPFKQGKSKVCLISDEL